VSAILNHPCHHFSALLSGRHYWMVA